MTSTPTQAVEEGSDLGTLGVLYLGRRNLTGLERVGGFNGPFLLLTSAAFAALAVRFAVWAAQVATGDGAQQLGDSERLGVAAFLIFAAAFSIFVIRLCWCGVWVEEDRIRIRNPLGTTSLRPEEVSRFGKVGRIQAESAVLVGGGRIKLWGIVWWFSANPRPQDIAIAELNRRLAAARRG